jgi:uncharacterized protein YdcH (DUF465 family)
MVDTAASAYKYSLQNNRTAIGVHMFPEYRELITQLKTSDHHFGRLFEQHNTLDQKIKNMESRVETGTHEQIEVLKKEKLLLKDQLHAILRKASASA